MSLDHKIFAIVVAAGAGLRAGGGLPKQYRLLGGKPLLARTLEVFARNLRIAQVVPVIGAGQEALFADVLAALPEELQPRIGAPVIGGETRQASVHCGLQALRAKSPSHVLIHDAARALIPPALIDATINAVLKYGAVIPGLKVVDTVKHVDADNIIHSTLERGALRLVQTPQAFDFAAIAEAHARARAEHIIGLTDDAAVAEWAGIKVHVIEGAAENIKITTHGDFQLAESKLMQACWDIRIGQGYDVHAFVPGDYVWLGGVKIPHVARLSGHSDADVLLHAMVDAILGALGDGDIGVHFPPSDPKWRGAASRLFLEDAVARVAARGGFIAHLDGSIICEGPKIGPYREEIRAKIAEIAGISLDRVGLKATTSEKLGFLGRSEGIAAFATATVRLP
jgi:2-C-methyl-D-erythritol 4-phosphate cytidylyltransferase/2-C-methyl-D-erythritol 2,4-cyclodiphosphate synthase